MVLGIAWDLQGAGAMDPGEQAMGTGAVVEEVPLQSFVLAHLWSCLWSWLVAAAVLVGELVRSAVLQECLVLVPAPRVEAVETEPEGVPMVRAQGQQERDPVDLGGQGAQGDPAAPIEFATMGDLAQEAGGTAAALAESPAGRPVMEEEVAVPWEQVHQPQLPRPYMEVLVLLDWAGQATLSSPGLHQLCWRLRTHLRSWLGRRAR